MKISQLKVNNFRKLNNCEINLSDKETLFVEANNSGKTSAMHALMFFLGNEPKRFKFTDISINYWDSINHIGESWLESDIAKHIGNNLIDWKKYCPCLYITLSDFKKHELPIIKHIIPDLSWDLGKTIDVCLSYEPKNLDIFKEDFVRYISQVRGLSTNSKKLPLPNSMKEFLEQNINTYFSIRAYLVDSSDKSNLHPLSNYPFDNIFKLSIIPAQRKFADSTDVDNRSSKLSEDLGEFYNKHLNPKTLPTENDVDALSTIMDLQNTLTAQLNESLTDYVNELQNLGYPGSNHDPHIIFESFIDSSEILKQNTKIKFGDNPDSSLPEELNGLGYRNLIHIFFKLLAFKAEWQKMGKASKYDETITAPIHLVLIEEPEAHLHSQVQQVFVKKAYEILTKDLNDTNLFTTQLIISTHSSYIIHEIGFEKLHYFKRVKDDCYSQAIDLSNVFDENNIKNKRFVSRYLRTVHCDLFFANAIILVEGSAERILLPYFIRHHFPKLDSSYISILEVNGAHAHRFKPLIEALGLPSLVLTDLDSINKNKKKTIPKRNKEQKSSCDNLTKWLSLSDRKLETVLDLLDKNKVIENTFISYQKEIPINWNGENKHIIPYTFEDSIVFSNLPIFKDVKLMENSIGMLKKIHRATLEESLEECQNKIFNALKADSKAQMALDILYEFDPMDKNELFKTPNYIEIGLKWLIDQLN